MKYQRFSKTCDTSNEILTFSMPIDENCDTSDEMSTMLGNTNDFVTSLPKSWHVHWNIRDFEKNVWRL